ncbi:hypothetical protein JYU20_00875 [Bacteroidales bacterium AH-315-I05]|nr:hypothetical protein [Bacteroidales bacterium AH-315-I05]
MVFWLFGFAAHAQNVKDDLEKISEAYDNAKQLQMNVEYAVYLDDQQQPYQTENSVVKKQGDNIYSSYFNMEIIKNKKYVVVADHTSKLIMLDYYHKPKKKDVLLIDLDSLLKLYSDVRYFEPEDKKLKGCVFEFHDAWPYKQMRIYFDKQTYLMSRVEGQLRRPEEVDNKIHAVRSSVVYTNVKTNVEFPSWTFEETRFLSKKNGQFMLAEKYRDYQLINHVNPINQ